MVGACHIDRQTLINAQKHPDEYRDLIVRVAGYSDHFRNLDKALQDEIIERTEQSFLLKKGQRRRRHAAFSVIITKYEEIVLMKKEYLYAGISVLCFGTVATVSKLLMNQLDALYVLAFSFLFATLFLGVYNWKKGFLCEVKKLTARIWIRMILIGSLGVFFYNIFCFLGQHVSKHRQHL